MYNTDTVLTLQRPFGCNMVFPYAAKLYVLGHALEGM